MGPRALRNPLRLAPHRHRTGRCSSHRTCRRSGSNQSHAPPDTNRHIRSFLDRNRHVSPQRLRSRIRGGSYLARLPNKEIAAFLGIPEGTVASRINTLKKKFATEDEPGEKSY